MTQILSIYEKLLSYFGHQGWWPVTPTDCRGDEVKPIYGIVSKTENKKV